MSAAQLAPFTLPDDGGAPPPPPDGSAVVPVGAPSATPDAAIPPPPDGSGIAPEAQPNMQGGFADELPTQAASHMSPEDEASYAALAHTGSAEEMQAFQHQRGFVTDIGKLRAFTAARDAAKAHGRPVDYSHAYELPDALPSTTAQAFQDGASQGASLGTSDEIHGVLSGTNALLHGGSFGDTYNRTVDQDRAQLGADEDQHGIASFLGNLAGGIVVPAGLEKAGITSSIRAAGLAARDAAIAEGVAPGAADKIAARAIAHRLAKEGAAYGGVYGAASADGSPSQRLLAGATGALTGAAIGGIALPAASKAVGAIGRFGSGAFDAATSSFTKAGAERKASAVLADGALRPIEDIVNDIANRPEAVPGSAPTLAEVAGDSGLAGLQRGVANSSPSTGAAVGERHAQNAIARTAYADSALGAGNPQAVQDLAASRLGAAQNDTAAQQGQRAAAAEQRLTDARSGAAGEQAFAADAVSSGRNAVGPVTDRTATGSQARAAFGEAYSAARQRTREAYAAPALTAETPVNIGKPVFDDILASAHDYYGNGGGEMPGELQSILSDAADSPTTTRTLTNLDRRLADFAGSQRMAGRNMSASFADTVRDRIGQVARDAAPQEYRDALTNAKAVRREQGRIFETGDAPKAFATDKFGEPAVGDTTVPSRIVRPGAPGGDTADGLIAAVGPDQAEQAVRQELRRQIDEGGVATEAQARSLATRYGETAKRFPGVQSDLNALVAHTNRLDMANLAAREADRATVTTAEKAHINELSAAEQAIKASPLSRIADQSQDPASFVGGLLRRSDGGRMLGRLASDVADNPEAVAGLRRSFGQFIVDAGSGVRNTAAGDDIPALAKTRKAISTIVTRAGDLLTTQQKIALQRVGRELKATNFAMNAGRPSGSDTAQNLSYSRMLKYFPMPTGVSEARSLITDIVSHLNNHQQVQHLITQAILDPDFAATLLKRPTMAHLNATRTRLLGRKALVSSSLIAQRPVQSAATRMATAP